MIIYKSLTLDKFLQITHRVFETIGPGRKESHYQRCLQIELHQMGIPVANEDPVPVFFRGEMVWQGRADLVIRRCCVELKANNKPLVQASEQLQDYIREKNKILMLQMGASDPFFRDVPSNSQAVSRSLDDLFWGLVVNFNPVKKRVEHFTVLQRKAVHPLKMISATTPSADEKSRVSTLESHSDIIGKHVRYRGRVGKVSGVEMLEDAKERMCKVVFKDQRYPGIWVHERELIMELTIDDTLKHYSHKELMDDISDFCNEYLVRTRDSSSGVPLDDIISTFEDKMDIKIRDLPRSIWFRKHLMRHYRITYDRSFTPKRIMVYGSLNKGLVLLKP